MKVGDCFKTEGGYGDDRPTWITYRRIRHCGTQSAECFRFEIRPSYVSKVGELVLRPSDPIGLEVLKDQVPITVQKWQAAYEEFLGCVSEPWNVE